MLSTRLQHSTPSTYDGCHSRSVLLLFLEENETISFNCFHLLLVAVLPFAIIAAVPLPSHFLVLHCLFGFFIHFFVFENTFDEKLPFSMAIVAPGEPHFMPAIRFQPSRPISNGRPMLPTP
jgi:hypothetical protein